MAALKTNVSVDDLIFLHDSIYRVVSVGHGCNYIEACDLNDKRNAIIYISKQPFRIATDKASVEMYKQYQVRRTNALCARFIKMIAKEKRLQKARCMK